jgi:hypothetical protein
MRLFGRFLLVAREKGKKKDRDGDVPARLEDCPARVR